MPGVLIDWLALEAAFESHTPTQRTCFDTATGELRAIEGGAALPSTSSVWVEPVPSREQYRMMERFIDTVVHPILKERLRDAIVGRGAFRRFKDALGRFPEERKRWFAFRDVLLHRHIIDWLKAQRIVLAEMPAWSLELPVTPNATEETTSDVAADLVPVTSVDALQDLRAYLLSWARAHGDEFHYLFGPTAFLRLAQDLAHEFQLARRSEPAPRDAD